MEITFFSAPKSFVGHNKIIQENAIKSWGFLGGEIILFGTDKGIKEASRKFKTKYISIVKKNEYGTPFINDIFNKAKKLSKNKLLCYINSDIILTSDLIKTLDKINFKEFLICGERLDIQIDKSLKFEKDWEKKLITLVNKKGKKHGPGGIDYFIFPKRNSFTNLPDLLIGRAGWDNFLIANANKLKIPTIDATNKIIAIHQNHDYSHIKIRGGKKWEGPESVYNYSVIKSIGKMANLKYTKYLIDEKGDIVIRKLSLLTKLLRGIQYLLGKLDFLMGGIILYLYYEFGRIKRKIK